MLSNDDLETARTLQRAAQEITDRMVARQLRALAEDYQRRAEKAAQADATDSVRLQAARAARLAESTLAEIEDSAAPPQERAKRKRKLTEGPCEFREDRIDQPTS